jgi:hypothetical protein
MTLCLSVDGDVARLERSRARRAAIKQSPNLKTRQRAARSCSHAMIKKNRNVRL